MAARIYLTGATGRLGRVVLEKTGAIPLVRKKSGLENELITDFSLDHLKVLLEDADVVIHLAASRDFLDKKKSWEGNVDLTDRIVQATPQTAKIIFSSSISVYGKKLTKNPADENTETRPDTPYAKTKLAAEQIVSRHPMHVILRIGPIYGSGFVEYFKVLRMIDKGKMAIIGKGNNRIPFVHVSDVADAIKNSIATGDGAYVVVGECLSQNEIYAIAARELGVGTPKKHMPVFLANLFAHIELFRKNYLGATPVFIPEDIAVLSSDRSFDCKKAKTELIFIPRPMSQGIAEMVEEYKKYKS